MIDFKNLKTAIYIFLLVLLATPVYAIPSPELVIGSVSSLAQIFAVGFAMVSGFAATVAAKLGFKPITGASHSKTLAKVAVVFAILCGVSVFFNIYQSEQHHAKEKARLQQTLIRPAQFSGTKIKDETLKEIKFSAQTTSDLSISTSKAEDLLNRGKTSEDILFLDVRETAENAMGTLPGSQHIRFPDIQVSGLDLANKKVILFCHNGNRSSETCERLAKLGIDCRFIAGGLEKWIVEGRKFSDAAVRGLSDLRAIPEYKNKDKLLTTHEFQNLNSESKIQIIDTRYPKGFSDGHLPNAINIPLRAMPTVELNEALNKLDNKPTLVACYDRRSCFMGQVLGLELTKKGIGYLGRYTTPWDYFIPPQPKPHVLAWLENQNKTLWDNSIEWLGRALIYVSEKFHFLWAIFALSLLSRLLVLPISLKSEKDQILLSNNKQALFKIKQDLKDEPKRRAAAVNAYHQKLGITPLRNLTALLFLPIMMLGLASVEKTASLMDDRFFWIAKLGETDPFYILPITFCIFAGGYLHLTLASSHRRRALIWMIVTPLLFMLVYRLSAASNLYLNLSLIFLLLQRLYVSSAIERAYKMIRNIFQSYKTRHINKGIVALKHMSQLVECGNKSYKLASLLNGGFPVPDGAVVSQKILMQYTDMTAAQKQKMFDRIWRMAGKTPCVVRSSSADEDGENQSYAGVFDSVLNVDRTGLQSAFETVMESFQSHNASSYHMNKSSKHQGNILIQQMIHAEYSGVLFTQDPVASGQMLLEIASGTADDLVSGRVTPLSLRFGRYTLQACDKGMAPIDCRELLILGQEIERVFGCPQDIEWAFMGGQFYIVQSRDITTLNQTSVTDRLCTDEWKKFFQIYGDKGMTGVVLKQDEMSEVLPRPSPMSYSIMASLWAPGGSVDYACRAMGLNYKMPESKTGHMYQLFGKIYVDVHLKSQMALNFPGSIERSYKKICHKIMDRFHSEWVPTLQKKTNFWNALDIAKLKHDQKLELVSELINYFVKDAYVMAEQINIIASFLTLKAEKICAENNIDIMSALHTQLPHAPSTIIDRSTTLSQEIQLDFLLGELGHRAIFDYELSVPRYYEAPDALLKIATAQTNPLQGRKIKTSQEDIIFDKTLSLAIKFQDLKEYAKHEALRVFAIIRTVLLDIDLEFGGQGLVFYLKIDELLECNKYNLQDLKVTAMKRQKKSDKIKEFAPKKSTLTLHDCEMLSNPQVISEKRNGTLQGQSVSGTSDRTGRIYIASEAQEIGLEDLIGFQSGDVLVCKMINPAWLPYVLQASAVVCEVGGWLSHMAIVAREHDILMVVGFDDIGQLQNGMTVNVFKTGHVEVLPIETMAMTKKSVRSG